MSLHAGGAPSVVVLDHGLFSLVTCSGGLYHIICSFCVGVYLDCCDARVDLACDWCLVCHMACDGDWMAIACYVSVLDPCTLPASGHLLDVVIRVLAMWIV